MKRGAVIFLIIVAVGVYFVYRNQSSKPLIETKGTLQQEEVKFNAPDEYELSGTFYPQEGSAPAVILIHQFGSDRSDYDNFIPKLLDAGYSVLAYDTRGFGKSRFGTASIDDFPMDIQGAISLLQTQTKTKILKIGVVGASVGANEAFVASGSIPEIMASVSLSPSDTRSRGVLIGDNISGFSPRNILIASDDKERADADVIFSLAYEPKEQKVYPGYGHGVSLLRSDDAVRDVVDFLDRFLK